VWEMFKELKTDCRRLPVRRGQPEPVVEAKKQALAETAPLPEIKRVKKKPRRQPAPKVVAEEPVELYEYPFVERFIEEPAATIAEEPSEFHDYSFDLPAVEYRVQPREETSALAYIVGTDDGLQRQIAKPRAARDASGQWRDQGDHLQSRRA
jgi:hypothetical protein